VTGTGGIGSRTGNCGGSLGSLAKLSNPDDVVGSDAGGLALSPAGGAQVAGLKQGRAGEITQKPGQGRVNSHVGI
jgi:hypothetical protein